jgi:hypothetical protein
MKMRDEILRILAKFPAGLTDRELTDKIRGTGAPQQAINGTCNKLASKNLIKRGSVNGRIRNYLPNQCSDITFDADDHGKTRETLSVDNHDNLSEDAIKHTLDNYLTKNGWEMEIAWGRKQGIDIDAHRGKDRWVIEVKGHGSLSAMRVNYFLAVLGELLQRMNDKNAKYSIALPDISQFNNLWSRLPSLAKQKLNISCLFVGHDGSVVEKDN